MRDLGDTTSNRTWHEDDFLVRMSADDIRGSHDIGRDPSPSDLITDPTEMKFGAVTLGLVSSDVARHERLALLRSRSFVDRDLHSFGARVRSRWAFDALAGRLTRQAHDWESFRALLLAHAENVADAEPVLDAISLDRLFALAEMLHERNQDEQAERALVSFIAHRVDAGGAASKTTRQRLAERALHFGYADDARRIAEALGGRSWARLALRLELSHPRFGGTFDGLLHRFNEPFRRLGLETVRLSEAAGAPFDRLEAAAESTVGQGPLVSVILEVLPGAEHVETAIRSIVAQTYANWELLLVDGDPAGEVRDIAARFDADARIRVISAEPGKNAMEYRNEGIAAARGDVITFQNVLSWSHPRRLETQLSDLLLHPGRVANLVHEVHVGRELSFVTDRGVKLSKAESTLMIRSDVLRTMGGFDPVPRGAERELRKRLELNAHRPMPALVSGAPLVLTLAPDEETRGRDYGVRAWEPAALTAYRSAARLRRAVPLEEEVGYGIPMPHTGRVDVLVVLDARESPRWEAFHGTVADEIRRAAEVGLTVGLLHSDALLGPHGTVRYAVVLEELLADGLAVRVDGLREVDAPLVVVRHAGAAQGHVGSSLNIRADRVVVVEDPEAGDARGKTIAAADVEHVVEGWFGNRPSWTRALPALPTPTVSAVSIDDTGLRVTLQSAVSQLIRGVRISNGSAEIDLRVMAGTSDIVASADLDVVEPGRWEVTVDHAADDGEVVSRRAAVSADAFVWNHGRHLVVKTGDGAFQVLPQDGTNGVDDLTAHYLSAKVSSVRVNGERADVVVETTGASFLLEVFAQREVESGAIRRRDFTVTTTGGRRVWSRPLTKFADSRWRLFGAFRTSLGVIHYPISVGAEATVEGTSLWTPRILPGDRILITPPQPSKLQRAARRIGAGARVEALRRSLSRDGRAEEVRFDSRHSQPRVAEKPTVSVVMPVYNVEPFLDAAISSVLDQDFRDLELILVDDASKDGGRRIIHKYWKKDPRVRVFGLDHNTLGGAGIPSNVGIRAARGEYVAFADSDDQVTSAGLARLVEAAETHDAELVIGDFKTFTDKLTEGTESYDRHVWSSLPTGTPLSAVEDIDLFRLSPVPWRKLYRRAFLEEHAILYPEGDYFYEDNPLHWFVLSRARRVVLCDEVISFHRMEREGQTMSAQTYKLGAFVNHMNTVLNSLLGAEPAYREKLIESFANYLDRTLWVATKQTQPAAAAMIRRGFAEIYERAIEAEPNATIPEKTRAKLTTFRSAYPDLDLTIVVPVYNSSGLLRPTLDSLLSIRGLRFDVLLVDDGSADDSLAIMEDYEKRYSNVHVFAQGNRGAGRARNSVIPLASGRYTYFLDADDVIDAKALVAAVAQADEEASDLLFMKYRIEYTDEGRSRGMFDADLEAWGRATRAASSASRQRAVAQLINYPWNRIIRTRLLHDGNVFFGPTVVHNDVLFHWHSIARASRISLFDGEVVTHRKFTSRDQITNINDARRLAVLEALRGTHERISPLDSFADLREEWIHFAQHLLSWAASRIPEELRPMYELRRRELGQMFDQVAGFAE